MRIISLNICLLYLVGLGTVVNLYANWIQIVLAFFCECIILSKFYSLLTQASIQHDMQLQIFTIKCLGW